MSILVNSVVHTSQALIFFKGLFVTPLWASDTENNVPNNMHHVKTKGGKNST